MCQFLVVEVFESESCQQCISNIPSYPPPPGVVTGSLQYYLDASEQSNFGGTGSVSSVWYPETGSQSLILETRPSQVCEYLVSQSVNFNGNASSYGYRPIFQPDGDYSNGFTFDSWIKVDSTGSNDFSINQLINYNTYVGTYEDSWISFSRIQGGTDIYASIRYYDGSETKTDTLSYTVNLGEFNHFAMTFNNSTNDFKYYVNGSLIDSTTFTADYYSAFFSGAGGGSYRLHMAMDYDEAAGGPPSNPRRTQDISVGIFRIYDRDLSSLEINSNYQAELGRYQ